MADRTADIYAESLTTSTTTSSTYAAKISQAFTGSASTDYWLLTSSLNWMTVTTVEQRTRLRNTTDSVTICEQGYQQKDASDQTHFFGIGKFTTSGSPTAKTFELQHSNSNNAATKSISDATFLILKAHASDHYAESLAGSTITNTAGQDAMATLSFTQDGDYLVIGYFEASISSTTPRMQASLDINGAKTKIVEVDWSQTGQTRAFWFIDKVTASGAQTYKVTAGLTGAGTITWRNAKVLALRWDSFDNAYYGEQDTRQTNTNTAAWADVATLTATPLNLQHLVLAAMNIDCSSITTSAQGRFIETATVKGGTMIEEPDTIGTSDQSPVGAMYVATLANASTTWKTQIEPETNTAGGDDSSIAILQLAPTPASSGGFQRYYSGFIGGVGM